MSWGGIDLVPLFPGETRKQAVARAYADAMFMGVDENGAYLECGLGPERDCTKITVTDRAWMLEARGLLEELAPGWEMVEERRTPGRRWPSYQVFEHPTAPMWVEIAGDSATLRHIRWMEGDDQGWQFWWRVIRRFAARPCLVYHLDYSEIVATSMSARQARERYGWL